MLKPFRHPVKFLDGIMDRIFSVIGAVSLSQFPQFYGQYMQRLGCHLDEARRTLDQYRQAAEELNLTLEEYIRAHLDSGSDVFESSGEVMQSLVERVQTLEQAYLALQDANMFNRWFVFLREADWAIAAGTWDNFTPGVPTTVEGLTYAITGLLIGWGLYTLAKIAVTAPAKALAAKKSEAKEKHKPTDR